MCVGLRAVGVCVRVWNDFSVSVFLVRFCVLPFGLVQVVIYSNRFGSTVCYRSREFGRGFSNFWIGMKFVTRELCPVFGLYSDHIWTNITIIKR